MDELKTAWGRLEARLGQTEKFNERMLRDMLVRRASRGTGGLMTYDVIGTVILFAVIPYLVYRGQVIAAHYTSVALTVFFCVTGLALLAAIIAQGYKLCLLSRVDMNMSIRDNLFRIERYRLFIHREKIVTFIVLALILLMPFWILWDFRQHIPSWLWASLLAFFPVFGLLGYYTYKKLNVQLRKIHSSLADLEALGGGEV